MDMGTGGGMGMGMDMDMDGHGHGHGHEHGLLVSWLVPFFTLDMRVHTRVVSASPRVDMHVGGHACPCVDEHGHGWPHASCMWYFIIA
eukprot:scaffold112612_cov26-Phaeocystis_antarctica.AAC.1